MIYNNNPSIQQPIGMIDDWIYVYKNFVPNHVYNDLYTYVPSETDPETQVAVSIFDNVNDNIVAIPRYCNFGLNLINNNLLVDNRSLGADIYIDIKINPRDHYQQEAIDTILMNTHGILCAKTAFGKTYVAIHCISKLKKKALILMHKRDLMYQWRDDIVKYTNLTADDVQVFTGNKFDPTKAITITTVQNIAAKVRLNQYDVRNLFKEANFGVTFMDECHTTVGPLSNSLASRWIFSKRVYGLSATPKRGDGFDKIINYLLGNIIYTDKRKMLPVYTCFGEVSVDMPYKIVSWLNRFKNTYVINYNKWINGQDTYIDYCANLIVALIKQNRKILAVASYKNLLGTIYDRTYSLLGDHNISVDKIQMIHGTSEVGLSCIKGMTDEQIDNFNCIFSTNKFFSEGISVNWLDTIVYLTPPSAKSLSAIPQLVGRIVREYKNKEYVVVFDVFNNASNIEKARAHKRSIAYKELGYKAIHTSVTNPYDLVDQFMQNVKASQCSSQLLLPFGAIMGEK